MTHTTLHDSVPFGLWVYIMSDCVLFATLFAAYAVLHTETASAPGGAALFDPSFVLIETLILLASSFSCGLAVLFAERGNLKAVWIALGTTLALGIAFLSMELHEFSSFIAAGHGPRASAFLSSFFALVGTHGLHIFVGCLWMLALFVHLALRGLSSGTRKGVLYFSLFWHFLDIVWIFIFSFVYLFGTLSL